MTGNLPKVLNKKHIGPETMGIYVGRPSIWGNPFIIPRDGTREEVIEKYEEWLFQNKKLLALLPSLKGKNLICWCAPLPCHGQILLKLANQEPKT